MSLEEPTPQNIVGSQYEHMPTRFSDRAVNSSYEGIVARGLRRARTPGRIGSRPAGSGVCPSSTCLEKRREIALQGSGADAGCDAVGNVGAGHFQDTIKRKKTSYSMAYRTNLVSSGLIIGGRRRESNPRPIARKAAPGLAFHASPADLGDSWANLPRSLTILGSPIVEGTGAAFANGASQVLRRFGFETLTLVCVSVIAAEIAVIPGGGPAGLAIPSS